VRILKHSAQWCRATAENLHATAAAYEVSDVHPTASRGWSRAVGAERRAARRPGRLDERLSARYGARRGCPPAGALNRGSDSRYSVRPNHYR